MAERLAGPAIGVVLIAAAVVGLVRGVLLRVLLYAAFAVVALLLSEHIVKPLVERTYEGELTFPSGNVTAVSAIAVAMWLALFPVLGKSAAVVIFISAWPGTPMSLAVVGAHWHTPVDAVGSLVLSVGIVTAGAAVFETIASRRPLQGLTILAVAGGEDLPARISVRMRFERPRWVQRNPIPERPCEENPVRPEGLGVLTDPLEGFGLEVDLPGVGIRRSDQNETGSSSPRPRGRATVVRNKPWLTRTWPLEGASSSESRAIRSVTSSCLSHPTTSSCLR